MRRQLRCVFPRGMGGSQKLWVLPGQDRGQWLLLQLPKNTLPGTVMNLALQLKPESAARLGHGKLEAACSSAQSPKEMMRRGAPLREPRERADAERCEQRAEALAREEARDDAQRRVGVEQHQCDANDAAAQPAPAAGRCRAHGVTDDS